MEIIWHKIRDRMFSTWSNTFSKSDWNTKGGINITNKRFVTFNLGNFWVRWRWLAWQHTAGWLIFCLLQYVKSGLSSLGMESFWTGWSSGFYGLSVTFLSTVFLGLKVSVSTVSVKSNRISIRLQFFIFQTPLLKRTSGIWKVCFDSLKVTSMSHKAY